VGAEGSVERASYNASRLQRLLPVLRADILLLSLIVTRIGNYSQLSEQEEHLVSGCSPTFGGLRTAGIASRHYGWHTWRRTIDTLSKFQPC